MVQNDVLRKNARAQLGGNIFANVWLMVLAVCIVNSAILNFAGTVAIILIGPMAYGIARITTQLVCGKSKIDIADLFKGFTEDFTNTLLLGLLQSLFTVLWALLFVVPGIIKAYSYSMATYIQQDQPNKDWKFCLNESISWMEGHKWQLFCLDFSFIGWFIVGFLCCFVGVIFVEPYVLMARANFYMALKAMNEPEPEEAETEGSEPVDPFA